MSLGDGTITNIAGYRNLHQRAGIDADGMPLNLFVSESKIRQDQFSNELRYAGRFGQVEITTGLFYFQQHIESYQQRSVFGGARQTLGGIQDQKSFGVFLAADWHMTDTLTLSGGARYNWEKKTAHVNALAPAVTSACNFIAGRCTSFAFNDSNTWKGVTPRFVLQWEPDRDLNVYASYSKGLRSGGYNISANPIPPELNPGNLLRPVGPFDQEKATSYELGVKKRFAPGTFINVAAFRTDLQNVQRTITLPTLTTGVLSFVTNVGDLRIQGFDAEASLRLWDVLTVNGQVGYLDGEYSNIVYDLNGDGAVGAGDGRLKTPRLAPWVWSLGAVVEQRIADAGTLTVGANYNHRSGQFESDNNRLRWRAVGIANANIAFETDDGVRVAAYVKNLTNEITYASSIILGAAFGGAASQANILNKGRVIGAEVGYRF